MRHDSPIMPSPPTPPRAALSLLCVTIIWGWTFTWMKAALNAGELLLGPHGETAAQALFMVSRFGVAALLLPLFVPAARVLHLPGKRRRAPLGRAGTSHSGRAGGAAQPLPHATLGAEGTGVLWLDGAWLSLLLLAGFFLQLFGLAGVTPPVSAFLTSLYVVFTALLAPLLERLLGPSGGHHRLTRGVGVGVLLATFGATYIGGPPQISFGLHEALTILSALAFALHILFTDRITRRRPPLAITEISFIGTTFGSLLVLAIALQQPEAPEPRALFQLLLHPDFWQPLAYTALLGSLLAITLMNLFQREMPPARAAVLYALEPVWAGLIAVTTGFATADIWLFLGGGALLAGNLLAEFWS
jgi:drug/metabolite transporter (DMT)-like permease